MRAHVAVGRRVGARRRVRAGRLELRPAHALRARTSAWAARSSGTVSSSSRPSRRARASRRGSVSASTASACATHARALTGAQIRTCSRSASRGVPSWSSKRTQPGRPGHQFTRSRLSVHCGRRRSPLLRENTLWGCSAIAAASCGWVAAAASGAPARRQRGPPAGDSTRHGSGWGAGEAGNGEGTLPVPRRVTTRPSRRRISLSKAGPGSSSDAGRNFGTPILRVPCPSTSIAANEATRSR